MGREKEGYRETLSYLYELGLPPVMTKQEAAKFLKISKYKIAMLIGNGVITVQGKGKGGLIPIGSIAKYLCG